MIGLEKYIEKYGKHFTVALAYDMAGRVWKAEDVYKYMQKKVYYNINGTTLGDMVYLFNGLWKDLPGAKEFCRNAVIQYVQDNYYLDNPNVFENWLKWKDEFYFDLGKYI